MSKLILCDIDGTVANNDHRQHLLKNFNDWDKFFLAMSKDKPYPKAIKLLENFSKEYEIAFLTGRPERYRKETEEWLRINTSIAKYDLVMRKDNDKRNKLETKQEMLEGNFSKEMVKLVIENDQDLITLWQSMGLEVLDVNQINRIKN